MAAPAKERQEASRFEARQIAIPEKPNDWHADMKPNTDKLFRCSPAEVD